MKNILNNLFDRNGENSMKKSLFDRALSTELHSRFVARAEDLGHPLTDDEVKSTSSYILFYIYNVIMPYFTRENVRYVFYMPWYAILTSIVMSVFCGFFSTYLPYRSYFKNRYSLENGGAGREYGADE